MVVGQLLHGKRYSLAEYTAAVLIAGARAEAPPPPAIPHLLAQAALSSLRSPPTAPL